MKVGAYNDNHEENGQGETQQQRDIPVPLPRSMVPKIPTQSDNQPRHETRQSTNQRRPRPRGRTTQADNPLSETLHANPKQSLRNPNLSCHQRQEESPGFNRGEDVKFIYWWTATRNTASTNSSDSSKDGRADTYGQSSPALKGGACAANSVNSGSPGPKI